MVHNLRRRGAAAAAFALASGTLLATVAVATPAGAASTGAPAFYSGATQANVLGVTLNLPVTLPGIPNPAALGLISATGTALHNTLNGARTNVSRSVAGLANGSLVTQGTIGSVLGGALAKTVIATDAAPSAQYALASIPQNVLLSGDVGKLVANVLHPLANVTSDANLASLTGGTISNILGANVTQQIQQAYDQAVQQLVGQSSSDPTVVNQVVNTIQSVLNQVTQQAGGSTSPVGNTLQGLNDAITQLVSQIRSGSILSDILNKSLISVNALDAKQSINQVSNGVHSVAHSGLLGLSLLGGLVTVNGLTSDASAFANGMPGQAHAAVNPVLANANVDHGLLNVTLGDGATGTILGVAVGNLPNSIVQQINGALTQLTSALNQLLNAIGVSVSASQGSTWVAKDGSEARATGGVLTIAVTPPLVSKGAPALVVRVGGATADAKAKQAVPAAPVAAPAAPTPTALPHTGANLPLTAGVGLGLLGIAAVLRRRMLAARN
jgi:LPXTG-motif cell wall-anchored protein